MTKGLRPADGESEKSSRYLVCLEEIGAREQLARWEASLEPRDKLFKPNAG